MFTMDEENVERKLIMKVIMVRTRAKSPDKKTQEGCIKKNAGPISH